MSGNQLKYPGFIPGQSYGRWLVHVRMALRSIGEKNPRPCTESWRPLYEDGLRPEAAVRLNMGAMSESQNNLLGQEVIVPYQYYTWSMPSVGSTDR